MDFGRQSCETLEKALHSGGKLMGPEQSAKEARDKGATAIGPRRSDGGWRNGEPAFYSFSSYGPAVIYSISLSSL